MKENKFITTTLILILGGAITRFLGFIIKILYTRMIGSEGISLLSLVTPTYSLLITIASLSLPLSISKLIAERKINSLKILSSATFLILLLDLFLIMTMLVVNKPIAYVLLKNKDTYYLLMAMTLTLPFISISSILKGYFFGKQNMIPNTISNICEQILKIILILFFLPPLIQKSFLLALIVLILFNIATELLSILIFLCFAPKKFTIHKKDLLPRKDAIKEIVSISLPTVSSRLIGNIGFFLEPIVITNISLWMGLSKDFITQEYGAYNAYSIALLTMPSFFIGAICQALVPEISKYLGQKNKKMIKRRFWTSMLFCFTIGLTASLIIFFYRQSLLQTIYQTNLGSNYIQILAPIFVLFYLEAPLISTLQALGFAKTTMKVTLWGEVIKLGFLTLFCFWKMGIYSLVYAEIINIFFVVILNIKKIKEVLFS